MEGSIIEGVHAPLTEVAAAELDPSVGEAASWVAGNLTGLVSLSDARCAAPPCHTRLRD